MPENEGKQPESQVLQEEAQARRDFLKKAAAVGVTAPAVALLLSAKPAQAQFFYTASLPGFTFN